MKQLSCIAFLASLACCSVSAQVTITSADLFNQAGLYYLAYSNPFDPGALSPTPYPTGNAQGAAGANQVWDFSTGPTNIIYRFDYLSPTNIDSTISANFPQAKIVEMQTDQASGNAQYLFFEQIPNVGRQVYGFYADNPLFDPSNVFVTPIVDFPDPMNYGQTWTTVAVYVNNVGGTDPTDPTGGGFSIAEQVTQTSEMKVDAWGTVVLPDALGGFGNAIRINESVTIDVAVDDGSGNFQHADTEYAKNFYWLMPGRGIVAAIASTQASSPPPDNFSTCTQFWRMFQTNKKPSNTGGSCTPNPVSDLTIRLNNEGQVLLRWSKDSCAKTYRVDYTTNPVDQASWQTLTTVTNSTLAVDSWISNTPRFYRIVSSK